MTLCTKLALSMGMFRPTAFKIHSNLSMFSGNVSEFDFIKSELPKKKQEIKYYQIEQENVETKKRLGKNKELSEKNAKWNKTITKYLTKSPSQHAHQLIQQNEFIFEGVSFGAKDLQTDLMYLKELSFLISVDLETPNRLDIPKDLSSSFYEDENEPDVILHAVTNNKSIPLRFQMLNSAKASIRDRKKLRAKLLLQESRDNGNHKNTIISVLSKARIQNEKEMKIICKTQSELIEFSLSLLFDLRYGPEYCDYGRLVKQLFLLNATNSDSSNPFNLIFINMDKNKSYYNQLQKSRAIVNCISTSGSHNALSPDMNKEEFVYLSPDAADTMLEYNHSKTYIIGGLVDKGYVTQPRNKSYRSSANLTSSVAKMEGMAATKLPLTLYLNWGGATGRTSLSLDIIFCVLATLKDTGDWLVALKHIPLRFHRGLTPYGKELASNRPEILQFYETAERIYAHHKEKFATVPPKENQISDIRKYFSR